MRREGTRNEKKEDGQGTMLEKRFMYELGEEETWRGLWLLRTIIVFSVACIAVFRTCGVSLFEH